MKTIEEIKPIVNGHRQKYSDSCSPSLVEMMLKIEGRVLSEYYILQDEYKNDNVGLSVFNGREIEGLRFHQFIPSDNETFAQRIIKQWALGRLFAVYTQGPNGKYHGWIVADIKDDQIFLLSKYSERGNGEGHQTAESTLRISEAIPPKITDLLFYTRPSDLQE